MEKTPNNASGISGKIYEFLTKIPNSSFSKSSAPREDANKVIKAASLKTAAISGSLALPPGPLGMMTILPDLFAVWKIQAQMVADIAAIYGKHDFVTQETLAYSLFKEGSKDFLKDVIMRIGDRYILRKTSIQFMNQLSGRIGGWLMRRLMGRNISRWLPLIGAVAVGYYTKRDTEIVGRLALDLFSSPLEKDEENVIDVDKIN